MKNFVTLLVLIASIPVAMAAPGSDSKPNIVLVLMDNFGYGEIGVYGGGVLRGAATPNIDGIAAEGFQLTNFNVEAECTPSRSALMALFIDQDLNPPPHSR
jgi:arylsulfatase A-like enzyme